MLASLIFLALDGHLLMIRMVVASFDSVPVGITGLNADTFKMIADWAA